MLVRHMNVAGSRSLVTALLLASVFGCTASSSNDGSRMIDVSLSRLLLSNEAPLKGFTNIFFSNLEDERVQYPRHWDNVEIAQIAALAGFKPINVIRYRDQEGDLGFVVDSDADLEFGEESRLDLSEDGMADFRVRFHSEEGIGEKSFEIHYQILAADGYTYARIREYRQGVIRIGNQDYPVALRPRSKNHPFFEISPETRFFVDLNRNGKFDELSMTDDAGVQTAEELDIGKPFKLGSEAFRVSEVDPLGSKMTIKPTDTTVAPVVGFGAPTFRARDLGGNKRTLEDHRGQVVLLEFWSVHCPFCEKVRPALNTLIKQSHGKSFAALAMALESDIAKITAHLEGHPKEGRIVTHEASVWEEYNPPAPPPRST